MTKYLTTAAVIGSVSLLEKAADLLNFLFQCNRNNDTEQVYLMQLIANSSLPSSNKPAVFIMRKRVFGHMRRAKAKIRMRIRAV